MIVKLAIVAIFWVVGGWFLFKHPASPERHRFGASAVYATLKKIADETRARFVGASRLLHQHFVKREPILTDILRVAHLQR